MPKPKIVDILVNKSKYGDQVFVILEQMPDLKFYRQKNMLLATDGWFYKAYFFERPSENWRAFAGAEFDIPLVDGTVEKACGQWWMGGYPSVEGVTLSSPGVSTLEKLAECYVFYGGYQVDQRIIDEWLSENTPSNDYYKYSARRQLP
jgi:hypothetical protein